MFKNFSRSLKNSISFLISPKEWKTSYDTAKEYFPHLKTLIIDDIEIDKISKFISKKTYLFNQIYNLNKTLKLDFNIKKPKLVISGLNPHAGENGEIGTEEIQIIHPVIKKLQKKDVNINGTFSADSLLIRA